MCVCVCVADASDFKMRTTACRVRMRVSYAAAQDMPWLARGPFGARSRAWCVRGKQSTAGVAVRSWSTLPTLLPSVSSRSTCGRGGTKTGDRQPQAETNDDNGGTAKQNKQTKEQNKRENKRENKTTKENERTKKHSCHETQRNTVHRSHSETDDRHHVETTSSV